MHTREQVRDALTELADEIRAERNVRARADMIGEFRHISADLSRTLLMGVAYQLREQRFSLDSMTKVLRARRETINRAVIAYARQKQLPIPKGFQSWRLDPELIVDIPPRER